MNLTRRLAVAVALVIPGTLAAQAAKPARPAATAVPTGPIRLVIAKDGNEARYRVREQLVNIDFPSDAVGRTTALTGSVLISPDGSIQKDSSKFSVDLATIVSDRSMRDRYIRRNSLQTDQYPNAVLVPTGIKGLPNPLPTRGTVTFQLLGDFTVRGVTKPTTWDVTADITPRDVAGTAVTSFTFGDFQIPMPRVPVLLGVRDTIRVEYDFHLVRGS